MKTQFKTDNFEQQHQYKSFLPNFINKDFIWKDKKIHIFMDCYHFL